MKIIIKEDRQLEILRKIWDKVGPTLDKHVLKMVGITDLTKASIYMRDYLGNDSINKLIDDFFTENVFTVDDCGTFNFKFKIHNYELKEPDDDYQAVLVSYSYDGESGTAIIDDEEMSLDDATSNEDYGWEVDAVIENCIINFLYDKLNFFEKTGLNIELERY
jgi:hypothetical protein